jgi:hypothetical protein
VRGHVWKRRDTRAHFSETCGSARMSAQSVLVIQNGSRIARGRSGDEAIRPELPVAPVGSRQFR